MKERVLDKLDEEKDETVDLCSQLIRIPSENPPGITTDLAGYLRDLIEERGIEVRAYEPVKGMPNLLATIGDGEGPHLAMNAHMDEFPAGETPWDAFGGEVREGRIFGRGASDMKGGLAASLAAFLVLHESGEELPGRLTLTLVSDEETGGRWGSRWLLENVPEARGDACLIGEATGTGVVATGEKGVCWLRVRASGTPGHGAHGTGVNAIEKMAAAIPPMMALRGLEGRGDLPGPEFADLLRREEELLKGEYGERAAEVLRRVTVNLGRIEGGSKVNIVAASCELQLDTRLPFGISPEIITDGLKEAFEAAEVEGVTLEPMQGYEASYTPAGERIVRLAADNVMKVTGRAPALYPVRLGATDARIYRLRGVPAIIYGPRAYNMAAVDEHITAEDLITVAKVHAATAVDFLGLSEAAPMNPTSDLGKGG